jgi:hypothetical protein
VLYERTPHQVGFWWVYVQLVCFLCVRNFSADFTHRSLSAPESDGAAASEAVRHGNAPILHHVTLDSPTATPLLGEWAKATLASGEWKDALAAAVSVSISFFSGTPRGIDTLGVEFTLPRDIIYRVICERLEGIDRIMDAIECFHEMMSELGEDMSGPMTEWVTGEFMSCLFACHTFNHFSDFTHRRLSAPGSDSGDAPTSHAILNSLTHTPLLREWAKAKLTCDFWKDALLSAVNVSISFYSRSRRGIDTLGL